MASSGSIATNSYEGRYYVFSWTVIQSVANNTSKISWELTAEGGVVSWYAERTLKLVLAGETVYSKTERVNRYKGTIASGSKTITHNSDGTKSFNVSVEAAVYVSSVNCKASTSFTLNTIPRATTPTLSAYSANMGASITISTPRASSSFTHDLAYSFAGSGWVSIATGVGTSKAWTVPDLATRIPNATSGTMTIRCITKNGSTSIGTETVLLTVKVPTSVVPSISAVTLAEATAGLAAQFGAYIQGKSKIKATITAAGAKGSTIKSYRSYVAGSTYTGSTWTAPVALAGTTLITTEVTDSRGRKAKKNTTLNALAYSPPTIAAFTAYRCTEDGTEANDGEYVAALYNYTAPVLNGGNTVAVAIQRKVYGTTTWETIHTGASTAAYATVILPGFSTDSQWDLRLSLTDWFGAVAYYPVLVPTADVILDILADGTGVGFGKVAEISNLLDVDWQLRTLGGVRPIVLENGTDLNDLRTPNTFTGKNANSGEYKNCPVEAATFTLEVLPAGDGTQRLQRFTTCDKYAPQIFERFYYGGSWGEWLRVSAGKVLWSGGMYMNANQGIILSDADRVSTQENGIILVFSRYSDSTVRDYHFNSFFVSKKLVEAQPGAGHTFMMTTDGSFSVMATKYLYIDDTTIEGHANNVATGTGTSGVKYENNGFVLRYVIGI